MPKFLLSTVFSLPPSLPSGLNSNLNVSLDMGVGGGSGGGAVSYKEPPQSRLKKLWATDPLEQNSKPGTEDSGFLTVQSCVCNDCQSRRGEHVLLQYGLPQTKLPYKVKVL